MSIDDAIREEISSISLKFSGDQAIKVREELLSWLQSAECLFNSSEYRVLFNQAIPFKYTLPAYLQDSQLKLTASSVFGQIDIDGCFDKLGIRPTVLRLLEHYSQDIHSAYVQAEALTKRECLRISRLDWKDSIDEDISQHVQSLFSSEANIYRRRFRARVVGSWVQNFKNLFYSKEYQALYAKAVPLNTGLRHHVSDKWKSTAEHVLQDNMAPLELHEEKVFSVALRALNSLFPDVYNAYIQSQQLDNQKAQLISKRKWDVTIDKDIQAEISTFQSKEPNHYRRVLKQRATAEWLQFCRDVCRSDEFEMLFSRAIPINTSFYTRFEDKDIGAKASYMIYSLSDNRVLGILGLNLQCLKILQRVEPKAYNAIKYSKALSPSLMSMINSLEWTREINGDILNHTSKMYNKEKNPYVQTLKRRRTAEWLQDMLEVYNHPEIRNLLTEGHHLNTSLYHIVNDDDLKTKVHMAVWMELQGDYGLNKLGIRKDALKALHGLNPEIYSELEPCVERRCAHDRVYRTPSNVPTELLQATHALTT